MTYSKASSLLMEKEKTFISPQKVNHIKQLCSSFLAVKKDVISHSTPTRYFQEFQKCRVKLYLTFQHKSAISVTTFYAFKRFLVFGSEKIDGDF